MPWIYLFVAGLFEVGWAYFLEQSHGFRLVIPSVATVLFLVASLGFLSLALRYLSMGVAYAVWTGIGAVGTVIVGVAFLGEARYLPKLACVALIAIGILGLRLSSN